MRHHFVMLYLTCLLAAIKDTLLHFRHFCSELHYDWRFTANQLILVPSPSRIMISFFFHLNLCDHSPYATYSLMRGWVSLSWIGFAFVKCMYHTYSIGLHSYGEYLFFLGSGQSNKSDNFEWRTSCGIWDVSLRAESHLYVSLAAVYWAPNAICIKCYDSEWPMNSSRHFVSLSTIFVMITILSSFDTGSGELYHDLLHYSGDF
jgi:hypothetical protein